jgi:hypothetical protein
MPLLESVEQPQARKQLLPWRPRMRVLWFWTPGIARLLRIVDANRIWFNRRAQGWRAPLLIAVFFVVNFVITVVGVAVVGEITIFPLAASIYAVFFEWVALLVACPCVLLARFALNKPQPMIARHRSRRVIWP